MCLDIHQGVGCTRMQGKDILQLAKHIAVGVVANDEENGEFHILV